MMKLGAMETQFKKSMHKAQEINFLQRVNNPSLHLPGHQWSAQSKVLNALVVCVCADKL
jgi:hypothetical protein